MQGSVSLLLVVICAARPPPPGSRLVPFNIARAAVQRLSLRSQSEWHAWVADNKPGITSKHRWLVPDEPDTAYNEWKGWEDWLGIPLGYEEARTVVAELGIQSQELWWAYSREHADDLQTLRVPSRPHIFYKEEWMGYDHWLSLPERPLVLPSSFGMLALDEDDVDEDETDPK